MRWAVVRLIACAIVAATVLGHTRPAHAYEFWLRSQSFGQLYQLRQYRLVGPDLFLGRRRYSQMIALRITDIGGFAAARREARVPDRGLRISWQSFLRIDHEFGTFANGQLRLSPLIKRDAIDAIPELAEQVAQLDLLYAHVTLEGIADDRVAVNLGRVLVDDGWGTSGVDGGSVRGEVPGVPLALTATAGLRVRADSFAGTSAFELDGTSGAGCQEYVEGATPGTGTWKLIDRQRDIDNNKLASDFELCPQREVRQPTIAVALATSRLRNIAAELGYRRTWSDTVGLIGEPDRFENRDLGLYPNESGQAPRTGVNEERFYARVQGSLAPGRLTVSPYAAARYSLLHATLDRIDAGVRLQHGSHVLEPSVAYFYPTFDGDSIYNVFSIEPTRDARLSYTRDGFARWRASTWLRAYERSDAPDSSDHAYAGGGDVSIEHPFGDRWRAQLGGLWDTGYGGRRVGGTGDAAFRARDDIWLRGRLIVLGVRPEDRRAYVTSSAVASASFKLAELVGLHIVSELDYDELHELQARFFAVLDLTFVPEQ